MRVRQCAKSGQRTWTEQEATPCHLQPPADVLAQQRILAQTDDLFIVFPVYWWSMPAQLKGWIDRVMTGGWSWGIPRAANRRSALAGLTVHVVPLAGGAEPLYSRHGYQSAIETQIRHGISPEPAPRRGIGCGTLVGTRIRRSAAPEISLSKHVLPSRM
ncbi:NAD(P)H-dependent oxidoreductase [Salinibacterium sp. ZJ450]|uniref:NAD(P)H-dependent oxidoreductase n=1 Tax=Salinibacterium sp. ZJ450 TaxID=2708338 RepID=UPI001423FAE2